MEMFEDSIYSLCALNSEKKQTKAAQKAIALLQQFMALLCT